MLPSNWKEQLRYRFDNVFAKGTGALIVLLAAASLVIIFVVALVVRVFNLAPDDIPLPNEIGNVSPALPAMVPATCVPWPSWSSWLPQLLASFVQPEGL